MRATGTSTPARPRGDLKRNTHHTQFYARGIATDRQHIVYRCQGSLWAYQVQTDQTSEVPIQHKSFAPARARKFVSPSKFLTSYALNLKGNQLALTTRGRLFSMTPWRGPVAMRGEPDGVRYRLAGGSKIEKVCALFKWSNSGR